MSEELDIQKITLESIAALEKLSAEHQAVADRLRWKAAGMRELYETIRRKAESLDSGAIQELDRERIRKAATGIESRGETAGVESESGPNGYVPGGTAIGAGSDTGQAGLNPAPATENNRRARGSAVPSASPAREAARRNQS